MGLGQGTQSGARHLILLFMTLLVLLVLLHALTLALNLALLALNGAKTRRRGQRGRISVEHSRHHSVGFNSHHAGTGARAAFPGPTSKAGAGAFLASGSPFPSPNSSIRTARSSVAGSANSPSKVYSSAGNLPGAERGQVLPTHRHRGRGSPSSQDATTPNTS